jgi:hypothetical protein
MGLTEEQSRGIHLSILVLALGAWSVGLLGVLQVNGLVPGGLQPVAKLVTACPYSALTGDSCPLCGTIRALALLVRGELAQSLATNALAVVLTPIGLAQVPYRIFRVVEPRIAWKEETALIILGVVIPAAFWLATV